jgi:hypothetical protein
MIYRNAGPSTRKFLYGDRVRFSGIREYRIHGGHVGHIFKTKIFKGPGARHHIRYGTECECGATLWPVAPNMELIDRPLDAPDLRETTWEARARYLLRTVWIAEKDHVPLKSQIDALTSLLSVREAEILLHRHGLTDNKHTLQNIADSIGLTKERVRQIERKAIMKLRQASLHEAKDT